MYSILYLISCTKFSVMSLKPLYTYIQNVLSVKSFVTVSAVVNYCIYR